MKFSAQALLEQLGWEEGQGLGKEKQGIKEAIKVKLKNDKAGVGHDFGEEFTYHWWDHAFNTAAKNIKVSTSAEGHVKLVKEGHTTELSTKKLSNKTKKMKKTDKFDIFKNFGNFVKSATLTDGILSEHKEKDEESDDGNNDAGTVSKYTDDELFKLCGGLTAHKGARHGINSRGKLDRINEQEQSHLHFNHSKSKRELDKSVEGNIMITDVDSLKCCNDGEDSVIVSKKRKKSKIKIVNKKNNDSIDCNNLNTTKFYNKIHNPQLSVLDEDLKVQNDKEKVSKKMKKQKKKLVVTDLNYASNRSVYNVPNEKKKSSKKHEPHETLVLVNVPN